MGIMIFIETKYYICFILREYGYRIAYILFAASGVSKSRNKFSVSANFFSSSNCNKIL